VPYRLPSIRIGDIIMKRVHLVGAACAATLLFSSTTSSGSPANAAPTAAARTAATAPSSVTAPSAVTAPTVTEDGRSLQLTGSWVETIGDVTRIGTVIVNTFDKRTVTRTAGAAPIDRAEQGTWIYTQVFDYTCPPGELPESGLCSYTALVGDTGDIAVTADRSLSLAHATGTVVVAPVGDAAATGSPATITIDLTWTGLSELGSSSNRNTFRRGAQMSTSTSDTQQRDTTFSGQIGTTLIDTTTSNGTLYREEYSTMQRG
jgi:hypothetical protein